MITYEDQMELFRLISNELVMNVECYAFGGNAMMFYGYKDDTKDVDLLFESNRSRSSFIAALEKLGYEEHSPVKVYIPEKLRDRHKPLMYRRGEGRFDLFYGQIFKTKLSQKMKDDLFAIHDFKGKHTMKVKVLRKEHIVLLKAITERDKDFEDILTIIKKEKRFDWQCLIDEAIWQHRHGDNWALLDIEKTMKELKKYVLIEQKYFKALMPQASKIWK